MSALATAPVLEDVPADADSTRTITCDVETLSAAIRIAYAAGRAEVARESDDCNAFLRQTIKNMQRSLRRARPTPREGIEAGLDLMLCAVDERIAA